MLLMLLAQCFLADPFFNPCEKNFFFSRWGYIFPFLLMLLRKISIISSSSSSNKIIVEQIGLCSLMNKQIYLGEEKTLNSKPKGMDLVIPHYFDPETIAWVWRRDGCMPWYVVMTLCTRRSLLNHTDPFKLYQGNSKLYLGACSFSQLPLCCAKKPTLYWNACLSNLSHV